MKPIGYVGIGLALVIAVVLVTMNLPAEESPKTEWNPKDKVVKTDAEWKKQLTAEEYYVLRKKGTDRPFTGTLWDNKAKGVYKCKGCGLDLFASDTKYKSGTGWPSFYQPIKKEHVGTQPDNTFFMRRTEVHCARCGGHLGHIFDDGPQPTGQRYCINTAALSFAPQKEESGSKQQD